MSHVVVVVRVGAMERLVTHGLASISAQTSRPAEVVFVREEDCSAAGLEDALDAALPSEIPWTCLTNTRTPGSAGSLNTALLHILEHQRSPEHSLVVFFDGESSWEPEHLEVCADRAVDHDAVMDNSHGWSGACLRLSALLMAGMFDEDDPDGGWASLLHQLHVVDARFNDRGTDEVALPDPARPFTLYVGIITADCATLSPLLDDLRSLRDLPFLANLVVVILQNGTSDEALDALVQRVRVQGLSCALVSEARQREDTQTGAFGGHRHRASGQVGIAQARTMLQRYLAQLMLEDAWAFSWVLDDDMRVDDRAREYLRWLPAFRAAGVDALIGAYEGSSPNPPLNGLRVQLVDLCHNLEWLQTLDSSDPLPDRSEANRVLRQKYPDYYYDLSRKHTGHLEAPHWLVPSFEGETVGHARSRLVDGAVGLLNGAPLTRPIVVDMPRDPLAAARDSVNRGGCTFILNPRTLNETPNAVVTVGGREARRSDMVWAIINRNYRGMVIRQVNAPVLHIGRVKGQPRLDLDKVVAEIVGSAFYGAFTHFLAGRPHHDLQFTTRQVDQICTDVAEHADRRLRALSLSFYRIQGLAIALSKQSIDRDLDTLSSYLHSWFTQDILSTIGAGVRAAGREEFRGFLGSLKQVVDDYSDSTVNVEFIHDQLTRNAD